MIRITLLLHCKPGPLTQGPAKDGQNTTLIQMSNPLIRRFLDVLLELSDIDIQNGMKEEWGQNFMIIKPILMNSITWLIIRIIKIL